MCIRRSLASLQVVGWVRVSRARVRYHKASLYTGNKGLPLSTNCPPTL